MKTLGLLRQYARDFFDVDADELPDTLIDAWAYEADVRIYEQTKRWPHLEATFSLPITANNHTYDVSVLLPTLDEIAWIAGDDGILMRHSETLGNRRYERYGGTTVQVARPQSWSIYGNKLRIWPTPNASYTLALGGYRKRTAWVAQGAAGVPDFPDEFEPALIAWIMHMCYMHQDDPEMADRQRERFEELMNRIVANETSGPPSELIIGGMSRNHHTPELRYDAWWG